MRKGCNGNPAIAILPQFLVIEPHFARKGCAGRLELSLLPQFLALEPHFVRKGCAGRLANRNFTSVFGDRTSFRWNRNFTSVFDDRTSFRAKGLRGTPWNRNFTSVFGDRTSFRAKGLRFVPSRWHCPCPRLQKRNRKEGEGKRARGEDVRWEDVKMRRCEKMWEDVRRSEDVKMRRCEKMWRWEDVKMRRCEKMWRWEDEKMRRWEDEENMWRWEDVKMRRCEDEKMWRWERWGEDVGDEKIWRWEDVKMRRCEDEKVFYRPPLLEEPCAQTLSRKTVCGLSNLVIQFTCSAKLLLYHKICHHRLHIFGTSFSECLPIGYIPPLWCQTRPADHHFDRLQYIFPVRGKRSHFRHFATILAGLHVCIFLWSILRLYHISMYILYIYIYTYIYISI